MAVDRTNRSPDDRQVESQITDDRKNILAAQEGDKNAYGELVLKYQKRLFRFIFMMLGRRDATEDIVQEAFVNGYLALNSFDAQKRFYPWLATIARNLALNRIKKTDKEKPASEYEDLIESTPDFSDNPLERIIEQENEKRLAAAVAALPEQYRTVFVLRTFEKMSYDEIAKQLNIAPGTVDSRLHRAREKLVQMLKDLL